MNILRSEKIKRYSCVVPFQTAFESVGLLISSGSVEIETRAEEDTQNSFFVVLSRIRALRVKLEKLLSDIEGQYKVPVRRLTYDERYVLLAKMKSKLEEAGTEYLKFLDSEEEKIQRKLNQFDTIAANFRKLEGLASRNQQERDIVRAKLEIFRGSDQHREFSLITGVCLSQQKQMIQRFIFRASRGHSYMMFVPRQSNPLSLVMFAFVAGSTNSLLYAKVVKLCQCSNISLYELPNSESNLQRYLEDLQRREKELVSLVALSQKSLTDQVAYYTHKPESPRIIKKLVKMRFLERIAYILCHQTQTTSTTHFLVSFHKPEHVPMPAGINVYESQQDHYTPRTSMPQLPVLYEANLLTQLFSVPRHDQIIPSVFMFVTLPVLFGMMYSDIGHGCMLMAVSLALGLGPIWLLMAGMSIYFGMLFNEFFGMKIGIVYRITGGRFGVDPVWGAAHNSLVFENSLKMKLSIVMGSVHMLFGMLLRIVNELHLKKYVSVVYESLPKLVVFMCTIGYMVYLILLKWTINFKGKESTAPSIISMVLEMYLGYHQGDRVSLFSSLAVEKEIAHYLKVVCVVCLLMIMFGKGIHERLARPSRIYSRLQEEEEEDVYGLREVKFADKQDSQAQHFGPLEAFEFVLSLISSITSYLRLFALSLSHQKLSHLLLTFLLSPLSEMHPRVSLVRSFAFFLITIGMMLMLDIMECIMHVIRLHWVQWMGKFYTGGGRSFRPQLLNDSY